MFGEKPWYVVNYPIQGPDAMFFWTMENDISTSCTVDNDIMEAISEATYNKTFSFCYCFIVFSG